MASLHSAGLGGRIDRRVQTALDLLQSQQSPTPCATASAALDRIAEGDSSDYLEALNKSIVPIRGAAEPELACEGIADRLAAARGGSPASEPAPTAAPIARRNAADAKRVRHRASKSRTDEVAGGHKAAASASTSASLPSTVEQAPTAVADPPATLMPIAPTASEPTLLPTRRRERPRGLLPPSQP